VNPDTDTAAALAKFRAGITPQTRLTVLTGAGISAGSGIPTFRGAADALWSRYRPEELATPAAFARDPELVWRWYDWRRGLIRAAAPNPAHQALAELQARAMVTLITQNVDGLHQRAGSRGVIEFHGSIWTLRCTGCGAAGEDLRVPLPVPPRCGACGELQRPGVVWFGEGIDPEIMRRATAAADACDLMVVVGTAGVVYPAAGLVSTARQAGARVLEFNLEPGGVTHLADLFVSGDAALTLPGLIP
jgi:NAD-dependent deacetylase